MSALSLLRRGGLAARPANARGLSTARRHFKTSAATMPMPSPASSAEAEMDDAEAEQLLGLLKLLDERAQAPVYAGCKWQADAFGVWTMVPWSDTVSFSAEVTSPGRVTRNGVEYRWHQHRASPYDDALAAPRGVWAAVN